MAVQFTRENARAMALKGNAIRWSRHKAMIDPELFAVDESEKFREMRLACVRAQLKAMDKAIATELARRNIDAAKLDRLASAVARLNEQERQLSNRSLPPTLKANSPARPRKNSGAIPEPTD